MWSKIESLLNEKSIRWIALHLTDLYGTLHQVVISRRLFTKENVSKGFGKLDGSSVKGFKEISESDMVLKPILETGSITPFSEKTMRFITMIYDTGGYKRFEKDPRYAAEKAVEVLKREGYDALMGAEPEFYILEGIEVWLDEFNSGFKITYSRGSISRKVGPGMSPKEGYYPAPPHDDREAIRREISEVLEDYFGMQVECHHHEVGAFGQVEINVKGSDPVKLADNLQTLKYVAKNVAARHGMIATFLPKPIYGDNGSGLHTHISLWRDGVNLFYDENDEYAELSQLARYFIGGLLEHSRSLAAIVAPTVNSYKRLVPGYEAPVYLAWSKSNRSAAVRVPVYHKGDARSKRIEYRPPDPSCNPYLAVAAILMAGLDGIKKKIDPGDPVDKDIYKMTCEERERLGVKSLPSTLIEAIEELKSDHEYLKPAMSTELIESYIELKEKEWSTVEYRVTPAELYYYSTI